ncbi:hypothetical protein OPV22_017737 [Ensete ventricosum]|uniref:Uncharacterized protein n=1 Tax=Ensete ventricosum TaxID=4639 RepID=A0AAV8QSQ9_ENSVE|nr:hypothetical protein OPV22_017737 [Ensete ventricosum]
MQVGAGAGPTLMRQGQPQITCEIITHLILCRDNSLISVSFLSPLPLVFLLAPLAINHFEPATNLVLEDEDKGFRSAIPHRKPKSGTSSREFQLRRVVCARGMMTRDVDLIGIGWMRGISKGERR